MIEKLYAEFTPIFLATGKAHYFEIGLSTVEQIYDKLPYEVLHLMCVNRLHPLYPGQDKHGNPMACWALDAIIELMQRYYHKMDFQNTVEGWRIHSGNIALITKSIQFSSNEYSKIENADNAKFVDFADYDER
jgi:hypothetical protein